jgi:hypothetical protein
MTIESGDEFSISLAIENSDDGVEADHEGARSVLPARGWAQRVTAMDHDEP